MNPFVELIALISVIQFLFFGTMTGIARGKSGINAPKMTGDDGFERMHRVQMNTLETLIVFLPALFMAGRYFPAYLVASIGAVYVVGRFVYWRAYISKPSSRGLGFMLSFFPTVALAILALIGILMNIFGS